jgi:ATP-dependent RNA helicase RhlE
MSDSTTFSAFGIHPDLLKGVRELGFTRATPIQQQAIPPAMEGRDVLACAMTGSGKTAAFVLPILHRLLGKPRRTTSALAVHTPLSGAAVFGGMGMGPQEHAFRVGVDVIVATPGRLLDHFRFPYAKLQGLEVLVLDEADRMLDMGFLPDIRRILRHLPPRRQTLFFSATMPAPIVTLSKEMLHNPATINLERMSQPAVGITQAVYPVPSELKAALLAELVRRGEIRSVIAFTRTKHRANRVADYLLKQGIPSGRIHGNRSQSQRTQALEAFKAGKFPVLVATDIAARGIDVEALSHVINFDVPASPDDYVHRVGRTARADATGDAFLFVAPEEEANLRAIERSIKKQLPRVVLPGFDYTKKTPDKLEVPLQQRLAAMRAARGSGRARRPEGQGRPSDRGRSHSPHAGTHGSSRPPARGSGARRPRRGSSRNS